MKGISEEKSKLKKKRWTSLGVQNFWMETDWIVLTLGTNFLGRISLTKNLPNGQKRTLPSPIVPLKKPSGHSVFFVLLALSLSGIFMFLQFTLNLFVFCIFSNACWIITMLSENMIFGFQHFIAIFQFIRVARDTIFFK